MTDRTPPTNPASPDDAGDQNTRDEQLAETSAAYVLNALTPTEQQEFEQYLAESETTAEEVTEMRETAALLSLAVTPIQPSPQLKVNLMAMLDETPQLPRDVAPVRTIQPSFQTQSTADVPDAAPIAPAAPSALSTKTQARWFNRPLVAMTAVAAAVALFVGGGVVTTLINDTGFQQQQADQLAAITAADDMQQASAAAAEGGTATLVWSNELGKSALIVDGLPELPSDQVYELWYIDTTGTPTPAGLMEDVTSERTWMVLEGTMQAGDTVGVTVEPSGGSEQPTTAPIVALASA
ncbi:MAG TPA: anti-sigma factor [Glaciihabitans sp.]|jgi:anti-sigma-K factor RskA|nr:anti-sigma factor [Glaciihabitans sp.]